MKYVFVYLLLIMAITCNPQKERGIYILNQDNLETYVKQNPILVVLFYNDNPYSQTALDELVNVVKLLDKTPGFPFVGKVKIDKREDLEKFQLARVPTMRFYADSEITDFASSSESELFYFFHKVFRLIVEVDKHDLLDLALKDKPEYTLLLMYTANEKDEIYDLFKSSIESVKDVLFIYCKTKECINKYGNKSLTLFKNFNPNKETKILLDKDMTIEQIKDWIMNNSLAYVMNFSSLFVEAGIMRNKLGFIIFRSDSSPKKKEYKSVLTKLAKKFPEINFYADDIKGSESAEKIAKYFRIVDSSKLPIAALYDFRSGDVHTYEYKNEKLIFKEIKEFIDKFYSGQIERKILSQNLKDAEKEQKKYANEIEIDSVVKTVVRDTFVDEVLNNTKDVMVNFYTDWCEPCHEFMPFFEKEAIYLNQNPDLVFAKIDMSKNTVDGTKVNDFPTFKFYPGLDKHNPVEYYGNAIYAEMSEFIKKYANSTIVVPQEVYDKKDDL